MKTRLGAQREAAVEDEAQAGARRLAAKQVSCTACLHSFELLAVAYADRTVPGTPYHCCVALHRGLAPCRLRLTCYALSFTRAAAACRCKTSYCEGTQCSGPIHQYKKAHLLRRTRMLHPRTHSDTHTHDDDDDDDDDVLWALCAAGLRQHTTRSSSRSAHKVSCSSVSTVGVNTHCSVNSAGCGTKEASTGTMW